MQLSPKHVQHPRGLFPHKRNDRSEKHARKSHECLSNIGPDGHFLNGGDNLPETYLVSEHFETQLARVDVLLLLSANCGVG